MSYPYSHTTRSDGTILDESIYNGDHTNHITNQIPQSNDDYSATIAEMQIATNPLSGTMPSIATSLAGELARLRYAIQSIKGYQHWYIPFSRTNPAAVAARCHRAAAATIQTVDTPVAMDTADYQTSSIFVSVGGSLRAPITGFYRVGGQITAGNAIANTGGVGTLFAAIQIVAGAKIVAVAEDTQGTATVKSLSLDALVKLTVGQQIQLVVHANTTAAMFIGAGYFPSMWMSLVGT